MGYPYGPIMGAWFSNRPFFTFCFRAHSTLLLPDLFSVAGSSFYSFTFFCCELANFVMDYPFRIPRPQKQMGKAKRRRQRCNLVSIVPLTLADLHRLRFLWFCFLKPFLACVSIAINEDVIHLHWEGRQKADHPTVRLKLSILN
jgi:hypothetical protein